MCIMKDLLMVSMNRRNDYSKKNRFHCSFKILTVDLGHTWKTVNWSFTVNSRVLKYTWSITACFLQFTSVVAPSRGHYRNIITELMSYSSGYVHSDVVSCFLWVSVRLAAQNKVKQTFNEQSWWEASTDSESSWWSSEDTLSKLISSGSHFIHHSQKHASSRIWFHVQ